SGGTSLRARRRRGLPCCRSSSRSSGRTTSPPWRSAPRARPRSRAWRTPWSPRAGWLRAWPPPPARARPGAGCWCAPAWSWPRSSFLGERALDDEVARRGGVAFLEAAVLEHVLQVGEHAGAAADHHAVVGCIERRHLQVLEQLARLDELGDAAL